MGWNPLSQRGRWGNQSWRHYKMLVKTRKKLITFQRTNLLFILIATDNLCLYGILHAIFPYQMFKICCISISNVQNMLYFYIKCSKYDIFPYRNMLYQMFKTQVSPNRNWSGEWSSTRRGLCSPVSEQQHTLLAGFIGQTVERAENTKNTLEHAPTVPPSEETTENTGSKENRLLRRRISPSHCTGVTPQM